MPAVHTFKFVRITTDDLLTEAKLRFGDDPMMFAFQCPNCGDIATIGEWKAIGDQARAGQDCIGRARFAARETAGITRKGCDWAAYGLFRGQHRADRSYRWSIR